MKNHILFAAGAEPPTMVILNAEDGRILTSVPIGDGVDGAVFNPATMEAFSSQRDGTLTVVFTWPLVLHPFARLGSIQGPGDSYLNLWTLGWDLHTLTAHPAALFTGRVFDANIFKTRNAVPISGSTVEADAPLEVARRPSGDQRREARTANPWALCRWRSRLKTAAFRETGPSRRILP